MYFNQEKSILNLVPDRVDLTGQKILDDIAKILFNCGDNILEIGGHTDSQGREQMNLKPVSGEGKCRVV